MNHPAWAVIGLGFGDEGKGTIVDFLARETGADLVVRWNGGPQAAHHVVTPEGITHCFAQFGSGMLADGAETVLCERMLVDPLALAREASHLEACGVSAPLRKLTIDPRCPVVLPFHKLVNQIRELSRGDERHGSCGRGVGEAAGDASRLGPAAVRAGDLQNLSLLKRKLEFLWRLKIDLAEQLVEGSPKRGPVDERLGLLERMDVPSIAEEIHGLASASGLGIEPAGPLGGRARGGAVVFEGAHGVLLDATRGFVPHVTKSDTTFSGIPRPGGRRPVRIGVLRAYATRHGAGPFVTEDAGLTASLPEIHNVPNEWQGPMRAGWLDLVMLRYAVRVAGGVDALAVTNLDRLSGLPSVRVATAYEVPPRASEFFRVEGSPAKTARSMKVPRRGGEKISARTRLLPECRPVFTELPGWDEDLTGCRDVQELPVAARRFLTFLASDGGLGIPVALVSVGPTAKEKLIVPGGLLDGSR
ncbi:MAG: adenylosuccinate synthetase [Thermoanaerobaculia bacterium]|nr:adenylosuccinate synthetase [Thermoanaerobaculia bacterium]